MNKKVFDEIQPEVELYRKSDYGIHPMFLNRWSPRAFRSETIAEEVLLSIFEAASWAPSARNLQPWRYIVAIDEEEKFTFKSFINERNWLWCQHAPVLALLITKKVNTDGKLNRSAMFDAGASWSYLALEANRQGLVTHAMGGFEREKAKQVLHIPEEYECCIVIAIGYQGDLTSLPIEDQQREKPSPRRSVHDSLFKGTFGKQFK